jgi:RimJ/RimL family protein N-acetyltransferase
LTIRPPQLTDAPFALEFINKLSREQTFITFQGEQQTLADEEKYLAGMIKKIDSHEAVQLFALDGNKVVANTTIELGIKVNHHVGMFGIAIADGYRDLGLGSTIMQHLFDFAKENLPDLKIIELKCFANNEKAIHVYQKLGFKDYGLLPKAVLFKGEYIDEIMMYKEI